MLYAVPTLVPTLHGRTRALIVSAGRSQLGALLVETPGPHAPPAERIFAELALYLRSAGVVALRMPSNREPGAANDPVRYAADVLGGVALLRTLGAERVVLIASAAESASPVLPFSEAAQETADAAFVGFLKLISARATSPEVYAQIISELVDTIRSAVDAVVGVAQLQGASDRAVSALPAPYRAGHHDHAGDPDLSDGADARPHYVLEIPAPGEPLRAAPLITQLYGWSVPLLRDGAARTTSSVTRAAPAPPPRPDEAPTRGIRAGIWQTLDARWRTIVADLERRSPDLAAQARETAASATAPGIPGRGYAYAWAYLDRQAKMQWLAACTETFPLQPMASTPTAPAHLAH